MVIIEDDAPCPRPCQKQGQKQAAAIVSRRPAPAQGFQIPPASIGQARKSCSQYHPRHPHIAGEELLRLPPVGLGHRRDDARPNLGLIIPEGKALQAAQEGREEKGQGKKSPPDPFQGNEPQKPHIQKGTCQHQQTVKDKHSQLLSTVFMQVEPADSEPVQQKKNHYQPQTLLYFPLHFRPQAQ